MMRANLDVAHEFYEALAETDPEKLLALLHPEFEGVVSAGLPNGFGGVYHGPEAMLAECWGRVYQALDVRPVPAEYLEVRDGSIVTVGSYVGHSRDESKHRLDAAFAHVLRFRDAKISRLVQITDSHLWVRALAGSRV
jgi:ketosteroid isomerase-like protein